MDIASRIRSIPDHPRPGILFRDITTLLADGEAFAWTLDALAAGHPKGSIDKVAGIESRGFVFAAPLALALGAGFLPIRKPGKLPAATIGMDYELEYGTDRLEIHADAIEDRKSVV